MKAFKIPAFLAGCFVSLALIGLPHFQVHAADVTSDITVGGVAVTDSNYTDVLGDGTVSYDPAANTLTLTNAVLSGENGICCKDEDGSFTVNIPEGTESKITASVMGITSSCTLYITGAGKLTISASWDPVNSSSDIFIEDTSLDLTNELSSRFAVYSDKNISVSNCDITANVTDAINTKDGDVIITDCTFDITATADSGTGFYSENGNITITGSEGSINSESFGILCAGNITISDSDFSIVTPNIGIYADGSTIEIKNTVLDVTSDSIGVYSVQNILISDRSEVTISAGEDFCVMADEGDFTVSSSTICFTGTDECGAAYAGGSISISDTKAELEGRYTLYSEGEVSLKASNVSITATEGTGISGASFTMTGGRTEITTQDSDVSLESGETPVLLDDVRLISGSYDGDYCLLYAAYDVTWENEDGTVLETDENVPFGELPSYDGSTPEKKETDDCTYTFEAWSPEISEVTGDITYVATFSETAKASEEDEEDPEEEETPEEDSTEEDTAEEDSTEEETAGEDGTEENAADTDASPATGDTTPVTAVMIIMLIALGLGAAAAKKSEI